MDSKHTDLQRQLEVTFGGLEEGLRFLICSKRDFSGRWFDSVPDAVEFASTEAERADVYVGVGVRREIPPEGQRGTADTVAGIPGFWIDIDYGDVGHSKKALPKTLEAARALLAEFFPVLPPSLVVFSGHGLQAWWLFPEAWIFTSDDDRKKAAAASLRFLTTCRAVAKKKGLVLDGIFDLSRVFRLAGTWNRKTDPPVATILEVPREGERVARYDLEDIEACFVIDSEEEGPGKGINVDPLILSDKRRPPEDALFALLSNDEKAKASWDRNRPDLRDQSPSSYDFSLAIFAARYGWTDQEIADLLIAWRVKHREELKTTRKGTIRLDYYQRTIRAARAAVADEKDAKAYEDESETPLVAGGKPIDEKAKSRIYEKARGVFGLPIVRFVQNGEEEDARFSFVLADGKHVGLGGGGELENQKIIRGRIYPVVGRFPKALTTPAWTRLWEELGAVREIVLNEETGRDGRFAALLFEYLSEKTGAVSSALRSSANWKQAVPSGDPFVRDGRLYVCTTSIENYVRAVYPRKTDPRDLWAVLDEWGFVNASVKVRLGGKEIARRYWSIPVDELGDRKGFTVPLVYQVEAGLVEPGVEARGREGDAGGPGGRPKGSGSGGGAASPGGAYAEDERLPL